jgi:hypothetical protein
MPVYSQRFIGARTTAGTVYTWNVPAGFVAVVRSIDVFAVASGVTEYYVGLGSTAAIFSGVSLPLNTTAHYEGHQVLNAGEPLEYFSNGAAVTVIASGYLLSS